MENERLGNSLRMIREFDAEEERRESLRRAAYMEAYRMNYERAVLAYKIQCTRAHPVRLLWLTPVD